MSKLNENEFKKAIKESPYKIYYIYGEEKYLIKHYTDKLQEKVAGKNPSEFDFYIFNNGENLEGIISAINTISFMGERTYVCINDFDFNKLTDSEFDIWIDTIKNISENVTVVISQMTIKIDNTKKKAKKVIATIEKEGIVANLERRGDIALERQIMSWATKSGSRITQVEAGRIVTYCGNDLYKLRNEVDKLCAYVDGGEITREVIEKLVTKTIEAKIFDLSKLVINRNCDKAYKLLSDLFYQKEETISIVGILSMTYVDMYRVRVAIESGKKVTDIAQDFDYKRKEFRIKIAQRLSSTLTTNELRESLEMIAQTDKKLKSARVNKQILVEELITKLMIIRNKR